MAGSIDSMNDDLERFFVARFGPSPRAGEWILRVHPLEPWADDQRAGWLDLIAEGFIRLAAVGGLCGMHGGPTAMPFAGEVEVWDVDGSMQWNFGRLDVDPGAASLLLNLCDWGTLHVAPAAAVEVLGPALPSGPEPPGRPLPRRTTQPSFPLETAGQADGVLEIQVEFTRPPAAAEVERIKRLLHPWHTALLRWGFALPSLPTGASEVRPAKPPLVIIGDLWSFRFERFEAREEALDVLLNCLERIHLELHQIRCVAFE